MMIFHLEITALRESEEETGLKRDQVQIIGSTDTVVSRYNVSVTPYVGIVPDDISLNNDSDEIEACFRVPINYFLQDKKDIEMTVLKEMVNPFLCPHISLILL